MLHGVSSDLNKVKTEASGTSGAVKDMGIGLGVLGVAAAGAIVASVNAAADYGKMLRTVQAQTGITKTDVLAMSAGIQKMAVETGANLDTMGASFSAIKTTGMSTADSMVVLKTAMQSALGTGSDMTAVGSTLAKTLNEFGLKATDSAKVMNVFQKASQSAGVSLGDFMSGTANARAAAATYGVSLTDVTAAMVTLTESGQTLGKAQMGLVATMNAIVKPTAAAEKALAAISQATGIDLVKDFSSAGLSARGFSGVMGDVQKALAKLGPESETNKKIMEQYGDQLEASGVKGNQFSAKMSAMAKSIGDPQAALLSIFPSMKAYQDALLLTGKGADNFKQQLNDMAGVMSGKVDPTGKAFAAQQAGMGAAMSRLSETVTVVSVNIGAVFIPILTKVLQSVAPLLGAVVQWVQSHKDLSAGIIGAVAALGTLAGSVAVLGGLVPPLATAIGLISAPLVAVVAAVALLYLAWTKDFGGIREKTAEVWKAIEPIFNNLKALVTAVFDTFTGKSTEAQKIIAGLPGPWREAFKIIIDVMTNVKKIIEAVFDTFDGKSAAAQKIVASLPGPWQDAFKVITTTVQTAIAVVTKVIETLVTFWKGAWDGIKGVLTGVWTIISTTVKETTGIIINTIKLFTDLLHGNWKAAWDDLKNIVQGFFDLATGIVKGGFEIIQGTITAWAGGLGALLTQGGKDLIQGFINGILAMKDVAVKKMEDVGNAVLNVIPGIFKGHSPSQVMDGFGRDIVAGLIQGIGASQGAAVTVMSRAATAVVTAARAAIDSGGGLLSTAMAHAVNTVVNTARTTITAGGGTMSTAMTQATNAVVSAARTTLTAGAAPLATAITHTVNTVVSAAKTTIVAGESMLVTAMTRAATAVITAAKDAIAAGAGTLDTAIKDLATVAAARGEEAGKQISDSLGKGIKNGVAGVVDITKGLAQTTVEKLAITLGEGDGAVTDALGKLVAGAAERARPVFESTGKVLGAVIWDGIVNTLDPYLKKLQAAGATSAPSLAAALDANHGAVQPAAAATYPQQTTSTGAVFSSGVTPYQAAINAQNAAAAANNAASNAASAAYHAANGGSSGSSGGGGASSPTSTSGQAGGQVSAALAAYRISYAKVGGTTYPYFPMQMSAGAAQADADRQIAYLTTRGAWNGALSRPLTDYDEGSILLGDMVNGAVLPGYVLAALGLGGSSAATAASGSYTGAGSQTAPPSTAYGPQTSTAPVSQGGFQGNAWRDAQGNIVDQSSDQIAYYGGQTPPGGSSGGTSGQGVTIHLAMDSHIVSTAVLGNLQASQLYRPTLVGG